MKVSIQLLEWEARRRGVKIQHTLNGGEFKDPMVDFTKGMVFVGTHLPVRKFY